MKTIRYLKKTLVSAGVVLFALAVLFQPSLASAKDHGWKDRGYYKHGRHMPPGQYKKYYGDPYYRAPGWYEPQPRRYVYHEGRRGYWENRSGIQFFINID